MSSSILMIIVGFVFLVIGAEFLVKGASNIATKFKIPSMLIGLTIVAIGTSAPELFITISSAISGNTDLIIGNAIGSNICNILLILGLIAVIRPVKIDDETRKFHIPMSIFSAILLFCMGLSYFGNEDSIIVRLNGIILLLLFFAYFAYPIHAEFEDIKENYKAEKNNSNSQKINVPLSIFMVIVGIVLLKYGGDFVVDNASSIAEYLNVSDRIIGLTIVAIGTALPELMTSIIATINNESDLAVGNLIGSCVFNLLLILGIGTLISPLVFSTEFLINLLFLIISSTIFWALNYVGKRNTITRPKGFILLALFAVYIVKLFI